MLLKQMSSVTINLLVVMTCGAVLLLGQPAGTFASRVEVEVIGGDYELSVTEEGSAGMENMAPGAGEDCTVTVENQGEEAFDVAVSAVKTGGDDDFFQYLRVTVKEGDTVLREGTMDEMQNIELGTFAPEEAREYTFLVEFPHEAGNEFQGAEVAMKWIFTAEWPDGPGDDPGDDPGGGGGTTRPRRPEPEEEELIPIEEEEVPEGPLEEPEDEEEVVPIDGEEVPAGPKELPKTGEIPPLLFYGLGLALVAAGVYMGRRVKQQRSE